VLSLFSKPWQSLAAFAFCVAGAVPYYLHVRPNGARMLSLTGRRLVRLTCRAFPQSEERRQRGWK